MMRKLSNWFKVSMYLQALATIPPVIAQSERTAIWAVPRAPDDVDKALLAKWLRKTLGAPSTRFEFNDFTEIDSQWTRVVDSYPGHNSCRRSENVGVVSGALTLSTGVPIDSCHAPWTTGYIRSKRRDFGHGYYVASLTVTLATGINNAFWMGLYDGDKIAFEIDVVEAHFPNKTVLTLHDWRVGHHSVGRVFEQEAFSHSPRRYGLLWLSDRLVYTIEDEPILTIDVPLNYPADIRFSTAVIKWAGNLQGDPTGTKMILDWLRIWN